MNDEDELTDADMRNWRASRSALEAGFLVEKDGEVLITAKGLAVLRELMERQGVIPRRN